jgi:hypothetical protein
LRNGSYIQADRHATFVVGVLAAARLVRRPISSFRDDFPTTSLTLEFIGRVDESDPSNFR